MKSVARSSVVLLTISLSACSDFRGRPLDASADGSLYDAIATIDCGATIPTIEGPTRSLQVADPSGNLWGFHVKTATRDGMGRMLGGGMAPCGASGAFGAAVVRLTADGRVDRSFGEQGRACVVTTITGWGNGTVFGLAVDAQQRVVAVGALSNDRPGANIPDRAFVLRLSSSGAVDRRFGTDGWVDYRPGRVATEDGFSTVFYDVMIDGDRIVAVGGDELPQAPSSMGIVARFNDDGGVDDAFNRGQIWVDHAVAGLHAVALLGEDYVVAGSSFQPTTTRVTRVRRDGTTVSSFGRAGTAVHSAGDNVHVRAVGVDRAGRVYAGGGYATDWNDSAATPTVLRFLPDGQPDLTYGTRGRTQVHNNVWQFVFVFSRAMHVQCDGSLFIGAHLGSDSTITAIDATGQLVTGFGTEGTLTIPRSNPNYSLVVGLWPLADGAGIGAACTYSSNHDQSVLEIRR